MLTFHNYLVGIIELTLQLCQIKFCQQQQFYQQNMINSSFCKERQPLSSQINVDFTPKRTQNSWTDQRIQQIKKKYDSSSKNPIGQQSKVRSRGFDDKQNYKKALKTQYCQKKHQISQMNENISYISHRPKSIQHSNLVNRDSSKQAHTTTKDSNAKKNVRQSISAFQADDNFHIKSTLNQKLQTQASQKQYHHPQMRLLTQYGSGNKNRSTASKMNRKQVQVQCSRINNIQKINSKIKHILQCINDCEKEQLQQIKASQVQLIRSRNIGQSLLGRSIISNNDYKNQQTDQLQQTKIIQKKKFYYPNQAAAQNTYGQPGNDNSSSSYNRMRASRSNNHFQQYLNKYKNKLDDHKNSNIQKYSISNDKLALRSSSCITKNKNRDISLKEDSTINQQKVQQINKQINRFHQKIEELQQIKRKMDIKFKPFEFKCSPIKKINRQPSIYQAKDTSYIESKDDKYGMQKRNSYFFKDMQHKNEVQQNIDHRLRQSNKNQSKAIYRFSKDSIYPQKIVLNKNLLQQQSEFIDFSKLTEKQLSQVRKSIIDQQICMSSSKYYDNQDLRKKIGERMQQRRKLLEMIQNQIKPQHQTLQTQKFINALCRQVTLDQNLRNSKNWFAEYHSISKIEHIKRQLIKKGISMTPEQVTIEFNSMNNIQNDPFFSFRQQKYTIESVVNSYIQAKQFWEMHLLKHWNFQQLLNCQNLGKKLSNKKQISIEDIVRLINTETGNFYRNRDIYLIFERIKNKLKSQNKQRITIDEFKQVFGK